MYASRPDIADRVDQRIVLIDSLPCHRIKRNEGDLDDPVMPSKAGRFDINYDRCVHPRHYLTLKLHTSVSQSDRNNSKTLV